MDYRSEAVTLLSNLVAIPSVSTQPAEADLGAFVEQYCQALGMEVERRPVPVEELPTFEETGECGTAVVITPVYRIDDKPYLESDEVTTYEYGPSDRCGEKSLKLYRFITGIQYGEIEDPFGWCRFVE